MPDISIKECRMDRSGVLRNIPTEHWACTLVSQGLAPIHPGSRDERYKILRSSKWPGMRAAQRTADRVCGGRGLECKTRKKNRVNRIPDNGNVITAKCTTPAWRRAVAMLFKECAKMATRPRARVETDAGHESQNLSWGGSPTQGYFLRSCDRFQAKQLQSVTLHFNYASDGVQIRDGEVPLSDTMPKRHWRSEGNAKLTWPTPIQTAHPASSRLC
ncbi:hypothetical protein FISHEDRAFT_57975 [Fistulina hepatica ATCC 64428]|uniref:Uncharacterized protein n=1 Tax=Fistulina hepatica ATCC 64428 TaxID=1128425 RepID=A0A0D7AHB3_9AGAR|nr:hypothetical protein FISHEDRAFT_57975 [Fistulina hepatica ATCC 64428]